MIHTRDVDHSDGLSLYCIVISTFFELYCCKKQAAAVEPVSHNLNRCQQQLWLTEYLKFLDLNQVTVREVQQTSNEVECKECHTL